MEERIQQRRERAERLLKLAQSRMNLLSPEFNLREIAKQMVLLEDHLQHRPKFCPDCIRKHLLTIEAYAEEAVSLDQGQKYVALSQSLAESARQWMEAVTDLQTDEDLRILAQKIRQVRKKLVQHVHDPREGMSLTARFRTMRKHSH